MACLQLIAAHRTPTKSPIQVNSPTSWLLNRKMQSFNSKHDA